MNQTNKASFRSGIDALFVNSASANVYLPIQLSRCFSILRFARVSKVIR